MQDHDLKARLIQLPDQLLFQLAVVVLIYKDQLPGLNQRDEICHIQVKDSIGKAFLADEAFIAGQDGQDALDVLLLPFAGVEIGVIEQRSQRHLFIFHLAKEGKEVGSPAHQIVVAAQSASLQIPGW